MGSASPKVEVLNEKGINNRYYRPGRGVSGRIFTQEGIVGSRNKAPSLPVQHGQDRPPLSGPA